MSIAPRDPIRSEHETHSRSRLIRFLRWSFYVVLCAAGMGAAVAVWKGIHFAQAVRMGIQNAQEDSRRTQCRNQLKQIAIALHNYHATYGSFPPVATYDAEGRPLLSWRVLILPFIDGPDLFERFHLDEAWDSPHNLPLVDQMPYLFWCPSHPVNGRLDFHKLPVRPNTTCYVAIVGEGTCFPPHGTVRTQDIKDGPANTIMVGEIRSSTTVWTKPEDVVLDDNHDLLGKFGSNHWLGQPQFLLGDGTIRTIGDAIPQKTFRALLTIAGGEVVDQYDF